MKRQQFFALCNTFVQNAVERQDAPFGRQMATMFERYVETLREQFGYPQRERRTYDTPSKGSPTLHKAPKKKALLSWPSDARLMFLCTSTNMWAPADKVRFEPPGRWMHGTCPLPLNPPEVMSNVRRADGKFEYYGVAADFDVPTHVWPPRTGDEDFDADFDKGFDVEDTPT